MAGGAVLDPGHGNFLLHAESGLLKGQLQPGCHIVAPAGGTAGGIGGGALAAAAENISENIPEIAKSAEAAPEAAEARVEIGIHTLMTVLVIAGTLIPVRQHLVGFSCLLELGLGLLVPGVTVRMELHCLLAVGFFDLVGAGILVYPQHLVVISFVLSHNVLLLISDPVFRRKRAKHPGSRIQTNRGAADGPPLMMIGVISRRSRSQRPPRRDRRLRGWRRHWGQPVRLPAGTASRTRRSMPSGRPRWRP